MSWRIAKSLDKLLEQLNQKFPGRSKVSDGGIGDARHQASSSSDHNPHIKDSRGVGVVTARDFTFDNDPSDGVGIDCQWLADVLVANRDPRIKYIIWNRQICSSKQQPWKWRAYSGKNPHKHHLHLSVDADPKHYDSTNEWNLAMNSAPKVGEMKCTYTATAGDSLSKIAKENNTTLEKLKTLNGLKSDVIQIGQVLKLN